MRSLPETRDERSGAFEARRWRRHAPRTLGAFLTASVAVHAAVLALSPPLARDPESPGAKALEVLILQPEPLPTASAEPVPQMLPPDAGERPPAKGSAKPRAEHRPPASAVVAPGAREDALTLAPLQSPQPTLAAPQPTPQAVGSEAAPLPSFSAAYLSNPAPRYPLASRRAGEQGTVTLRVLVARDGSPLRVEVEKSSGSRHLDGAALEAVRGWRFVPARRGAEPLDSWLLVPVVFRLEGTS